MTISYNDLANEITDAFFEPPTPEGVATYITQYYHLVPRRTDSSISIDLDAGTVTYGGETRTIPDYVNEKNLLDRVAYDLTMLEAHRQLKHHLNAQEIEKLAQTLHSVSDASLADCREQAKELYDSGVRLTETFVKTE